MREIWCVIFLSVHLRGTDLTFIYASTDVMVEDSWRGCSRAGSPVPCGQTSHLPGGADAQTPWKKCPGMGGGQAHKSSYLQHNGSHFLWVSWRELGWPVGSARPLSPARLFLSAVLLPYPHSCRPVSPFPRATSSPWGPGASLFPLTERELCTHPQPPRPRSPHCRGLQHGLGQPAPSRRAPALTGRPPVAPQPRSLFFGSGRGHTACRAGKWRPAHRGSQRGPPVCWAASADSAGLCGKAVRALCSPGSCTLCSIYYVSPVGTLNFLYQQAVLRYNVVTLTFHFRLRNITKKILYDHVFYSASVPWWKNLHSKNFRTISMLTDANRTKGTVRWPFCREYFSYYYFLSVFRGVG